MWMGNLYLKAIGNRFRLKLSVALLIKRDSPDIIGIQM
jgi:hypothetical protein